MFLFLVLLLLSNFKFIFIITKSVPNFIYYSNFIKFKFLTLYYTDNSKKYFRKIKYFWIILFGFCFMYNAKTVPQIKNKAISSRHYLIKQTHIMNRVLFLYVHYILTIHLSYDTDLKNNAPKNPIKWRYETESEKQIASIKDALWPRAV